MMKTRWALIMELIVSGGLELITWFNVVVIACKVTL